MKLKLQTYVRSVAVLLALTLLFSLVFAVLYYFHAASTSTFHILSWIGGIIAYGAGGILLGTDISKKTLFHALPVAVVLYLLPLLLSGFSLPVLLENLSKALVHIAVIVTAFSRTHKGQISPYTETAPPADHSRDGDRPSLLQRVRAVYG